MTWEITTAHRDSIDELKGYVGILLVEVERLDANTFNVTVPDEKSDDVVEFCETHNLPCRLV